MRYIFTENGCGFGIQRIMDVLETINITQWQMAFDKSPNCKSTYAQTIQMMILFPFFSIRNAAYEFDVKNPEMLVLDLSIGGFRQNKRH